MSIFFTDKLKRRQKLTGYVTDETSDEEGEADLNTEVTSEDGGESNQDTGPGTQTDPLATEEQSSGETEKRCK